jgi:glycosyltransferase involved in cell wall biosynthesis
MAQGLIKKHNILGVSSLWTGAYPFFFEGNEISKGMPAFNNVFLRLLEDERVDRFHLFLIDKKPNKPLNIPDKYKNKLVIYLFDYNSSNRFLSIFLFLKIIVRGVSIVKSKKVTKILGFGSLAGLSAIIGKITSIPDFRRLYGSFLINEIHLSNFSLFIKHPLEYLCFYLSGKGLMITNDGTKGDVVFKKIGNKKLPFYFMLNGVDNKIKDNLIKPKFELPSSFISYAARVNDWKRQHLLVEAVGILKKEKKNFPKVIIIGSLHDEKYVLHLKHLIKELNLEEDVILVGGLEISEVHYILQKSLITYSLYHTSNLGNVFLESMKLGVPVIALNDTDSLALIDEGAFFELRSADPQLIADVTLKLLSNEDQRKKLSENAILFADKNLSSWDQRANYEIDIVLN